MNRYQQELCMNLNELLSDDYALLGEVIEEYVTLLGDTNRMHDMHEFTSLLQSVTNACQVLTTLL